MEQLRFGLILLGLGERQGHAIERRRHMPRQLALQHVIVEVGVQIGQDRAARLHSVDPAERVID